MNDVKVGLIGCGDISEKYIDTMKNLFHVDVVAVTDKVPEKARNRADQFGIPRVCRSNQELVSMPEVDLVVVLTTPPQHFSVCELALQANKHVYVEKPLSLTREEGKKLLDLAEKEDRMLSCAPDTILAAGVQTGRKLIDDGWIGRPFAATSHIATGGHESWHPNPEFFYKEGGGPLFDVAPYYITALAYLLGPVESAVCSAMITYPERTITSQPLYGQKISVEVPTHLAGILNLKGGIIATILHSFDVPNTQMGWDIEIYGTEGTLIVPSPCMFGGEILYKKTVRGRPKGDVAAKNGEKTSGIAEVLEMVHRMEGWSVLPLLHCYDQDYRGIGVADMVDALKKGRKQRLGADLGYHVLDVMVGLMESWKEDRIYHVQSTFERTAPMKLGAKPGSMD